MTTRRVDAIFARVERFLPSGCHFGVLCGIAKGHCSKEIRLFSLFADHQLSFLQERLRLAVNWFHIEDSPISHASAWLGWAFHTEHTTVCSLAYVVKGCTGHNV